MSSTRQITNRIKIVSLLATCATSAIVLIYAHSSQPLLSISPYPDGKNFAFTIIDDPDLTSLEKVEPIYELLDQLGFKTTIACWVRKPKDLKGMPYPEEQEKSDTLENQQYMNFLKKYQNKGFEIALHTATSGNDLREDTIKGYERFKEVFGNYPNINIMHSKNRENIYWGKNVFKNWFLRWIVSFYDKTPFSGEDPKSHYFWGDICKEKTKYVRLWGTHNINTLKFNPSMPYHNARTPYVNYWFSFSEGHTGHVFNRLLSDKNIKILASERGASIVYTHFGSNFDHKTKNGEYLLNSTTKYQLTKIANQKNGWFVPASELLDRLLLMKRVVLSELSSTLVLTNFNPMPVDGVTVLARPGSAFYNSENNIICPNEDGEIVLGSLPAYGSIALYKSNTVSFIRNPVPTWYEKVRFIFSRFLVWVTTRFDL